MSIITKIDSIPLFTSKAEALRFARLNGLIGFHEHTYFGKKGYMAGRNHNEAVRTNGFINKTTADVSIVKLQKGLYKVKDIEPIETVDPIEPIEPVTPIVQTTVQTPATPRVTQTTYSTSSGGGSGGY